MSKGMLGAAGGLSAEDREKLIPENLREGVVLFAGTAREAPAAHGIRTSTEAPVAREAW